MRTFKAGVSWHGVWVGIRVDASIQIGAGHVARCLTLAQRLRKAGARVVFICREHPGNLCDWITQSGFRVCRMPVPSGSQKMSSVKTRDWLGVPWKRDATETIAFLNKIPACEWLIVDHYGLDARWEKIVGQRTRHLMVIDDLSDRAHHCDVLLDSNDRPGGAAQYRRRTPASCRLLLGPRFALLRPEFRRRAPRRARFPVRRVFVFLGGVDRTNVTKKVLNAFKQLNRDNLFIDVVIGPENPHRERLEKLCAGLPQTSFNVHVSDMAARMRRADLGVGAGGGSVWERLAVGLPSLVIAIAANQEILAKNFSKKKWVRYAGRSSTLSVRRLARLLKELMDDRLALFRMSQAAKQVDGRGADRVLEVMEKCHAAGR